MNRQLTRDIRYDDCTDTYFFSDRDWAVSGTFIRSLVDPSGLVGRTFRIEGIKNGQFIIKELK